MRKIVVTVARRGLSALAATIVLAALIHLGVALITFLGTGNIAYVNPIDFLGFGIIFQQYLHSEIAAGAAWAVLIATFFAIYWLHVRFKLEVTLSAKRRNASDVRASELSPGGLVSSMQSISVASSVDTTR